MIHWTKDEKVDRSQWEDVGAVGLGRAGDLADALDVAVAALNGMVGLIQLLAHNDDIPAMTRMGIVNNHRVVEARRFLRQIGADHAGSRTQ